MTQSNAAERLVVTHGNRLGSGDVSGRVPVDDAHQRRDRLQVRVLTPADNLEATDQVGRMQTQHRLVIVLGVSGSERLNQCRIVRMKASDWIRIVAWACLLTGISLVAWQAASGNNSDMLFNIGVMALITGSVLRVYGKYRSSNRRVDLSREPPENLTAN
jgi:hypothetical protein